MKPSVLFGIGLACLLGTAEAKAATSATEPVRGPGSNLIGIMLDDAEATAPILREGPPVGVFHPRVLRQRWYSGRALRP